MEYAPISLPEAPGKEVGHAEVTRNIGNHRSLVHQLLLVYQLLR
jgi:hypothetical protein